MFLNDFWSPVENSIHKWVLLLCSHLTSPMTMNWRTPPPPTCYIHSKWKMVDDKLGFVLWLVFLTPISFLLFHQLWWSVWKDKPNLLSLTLSKWINLWWNIKTTWQWNMKSTWRWKCETWNQLGVKTVLQLMDGNEYFLCKQNQPADFVHMNHVIVT